VNISLLRFKKKFKPIETEKAMWLMNVIELANFIPFVDLMKRNGKTIKAASNI